MTDAATVSDVEIHFERGEPVYFTCDASRGDKMETMADGSLSYCLFPSPGIEDVFIIDRTKVRYTRIVTRPADVEPREAYIGDGVTVTGEAPV